MTKADAQLEDLEARLKEFKAQPAFWSPEEAIALCATLEGFAPDFGAHIALTGGCLYKRGKRKDADILVYRIRQATHIDIEGFFEAISAIGVNKLSGFGWCHKAEYKGGMIDFFFPEEQGGTYD